jgi:transposase
VLMDIHKDCYSAIDLPDKTVPTGGRQIYKWRHLIENFFCKLKDFKRIAMRADKTDQSFAANIHLAAALINSR